MLETNRRCGEQSLTELWLRVSSPLSSHLGNWPEGSYWMCLKRSSTFYSLSVKTRQGHPALCIALTPALPTPSILCVLWAVASRTCFASGSLSCNPSEWSPCPLGGSALSSRVATAACDQRTLGMCWCKPVGTGCAKLTQHFRLRAKRSVKRLGDTDCPVNQYQAQC